MYVCAFCVVLERTRAPLVSLNSSSLPVSVLDLLLLGLGVSLVRLLFCVVPTELIDCEILWWVLCDVMQLSRIC